MALTLGQSTPGFNERFAVWLTARVGSMPTAYLFATLAMISLPTTIATGNLLYIVGWLSGTFIQLVLLPVIMVGQDVASRHTEQVINDSHQQLTQVLAEQAETIRDQHLIIAALHALLTADSSDDAAAVAQLEQEVPPA